MIRFLPFQLRLVKKREQGFQFCFAGAGSVFTEFEGFGKLDGRGLFLAIPLDECVAIAVCFTALPEVPAALEPGAAGDFIIGRRDVFLHVFGAAVGTAFVGLRG